MGGREEEREREEELRNGGGGGGGRRQRGDKLNSIVFLDGIGHFEGGRRRRLKEGRKGKRPFHLSLSLSSFLSSNFQVDI